MANDKLHEAHSRTVEWQAAFIQGIAASAIAFGIHETADREPALSLIPIAAALLLWSGSFAAGVVNNHARQRAISANIAANLARSAGREDLLKKADDRFITKTKLAGNAYTSQLFLILIGAIAYLVGHGMHIFENEKRSKTIERPAGAVSPATVPKNEKGSHTLTRKTGDPK